MCSYNPYPILCHVSNDRKKEFSQKREGRKETEEEREKEKKRERGICSHLGKLRVSKSSQTASIIALINLYFVCGMLFCDKLFHLYI